MAKQRVGKRGSAAEKLGWRLGVQAYTFHKFTFYEAVDKVASLGLKYIEAYPGQPLSKGRPDIRTNHDMPPAIRSEVKKTLRAAGVKLVCYGVVRLRKDEPECRNRGICRGCSLLDGCPLPQALSTRQGLGNQSQQSD